MVGRFNTLSGTFSMDDANPTAARASFEVETASVDTNHLDRDKHLRSPDFLDVKQYPTMTFTSTSYEGTKNKVHRVRAGIPSPPARDSGRRGR